MIVWPENLNTSGIGESCKICIDTIDPVPVKGTNKSCICKRRIDV